MEEPALELGETNYLADEAEIEAIQRRNHGKIDPTKLHPDMLRDILAIARDVNRHDGLLKMQITFHGELDTPPTIHVITEPTDEAIDRWLS